MVRVIAHSRFRAGDLGTSGARNPVTPWSASPQKAGTVYIRWVGERVVEVPRVRIPTTTNTCTKHQRFSREARILSTSSNTYGTMRAPPLSTPQELFEYRVVNLKSTEDTIVGDACLRKTMSRRENLAGKLLESVASTLVAEQLLLVYAPANVSALSRPRRTGSRDKIGFPQK